MRRFDDRPPWRRAAVVALVLGSLGWAAHRSGVHPARLLDPDGLSSALGILSGFGHPDVSGDFLARVARLSLESLAIGVLGTALAAVLGVGMAVIGMRVPDLPDPPRGSWLVRAAAEALRLGVRFVLGVLRSIPDIVWALLFVRMLGLGPGPAVLAIAVSTGGIMGKLFAELAEAVDPGPIHALRRAGAGRLAVLVHGVLPQVQRSWVAYALFRLECSIRSASILGVVGAGGLGSEIALSVRYFQYDKLATALLAVLGFVAATEAVSAALRRRSIRWTVAVIAVGSLASFLYLPIPWAELWRSSPLAGGLSVSSTWHVAEVARRAWPLLVETVAMAWCATLAAAAVAFLLAPLATRALVAGSYLRDPPRRRGPAFGLGLLAFAGARAVFQVCRAIPELTLALLFVVWVRPGPFAGALAIALHTVGVLGRLYGDVYEEVEPGPVAALEATGASRFAVWLHAVVPQVGPRILAFTLYRFEVNVRMTAIVGFAGAGGIGDAIQTAISLFHMTELAVLLAVILVAVTVLDRVGDQLRYRILVARFARTREGPRERPSRLSRFRMAPARAQQGERDVLHETRDRGGVPGDRDERGARIRLLGPEEE
ncbi:MAG TPA: ABC transporter permease subunit [Kofleriaceae bacterium]|nr:ABC transporter permease subunit [Kofleriaceae bacterium]